MLNIAKKYQKEYNDVRRACDPTTGNHASYIPSRTNRGRHDLFESYLKKYAATYELVNVDKNNVELIFKDADGEIVGGYYLQQYQVDYVIECILGYKK